MVVKSNIDGLIIGQQKLMDYGLIKTLISWREKVYENGKYCKGTIESKILFTRNV